MIDMGTTLDSQTLMPADLVGMEQLHSFLAGHGPAGPGRCFLVGSTPGDQMEIPEALYRTLQVVVEALSRGLAVTVAPQPLTLTTQQAADLLGISRPTLIKLLEAGELPFHTVGTHRRIGLQDVVDYRQHRRDTAFALLQEMADETDEADEPATALRRAREARRVIGSRRHRLPTTVR